MGLECGGIKDLVGVGRECRVGNRDGGKIGLRCGNGRVAADF